MSNIDIRKLGLEDLHQAGDVFYQRLVNNHPIPGEPELIHRSTGTGTKLVIQADSNIDTQCAIRLLVQATKGGNCIGQC